MVSTTSASISTERRRRDLEAAITNCRGRLIGLRRALAEVVDEPEIFAELGDEKVSYLRTLDGMLSVTDYYVRLMAIDM